VLLGKVTSYGEFDPLSLVGFNHEADPEDNRQCQCEPVQYIQRAEQKPLKCSFILKA
jgi:hypothetical protein